MTILGNIILTEEQEAAIQFWLLDLTDRYAATGQNRDERIHQLELALIDLENWIVAAEPLVPFGLPASFGQWRRPEK